MSKRSAKYTVVVVVVVSTPGTNVAMASVSISGSDQVTIKEGQDLNLEATCYNNKNEEIDNMIWNVDVL